MTIHLSPELEDQVRKGAAESGFDDVQAYVEAVLMSSRDVADWVPEDLERVRAQIEQGFRESERGEIVSSEELWRSLEEHKTSWLRVNSRDAA